MKIPFVGPAYTARSVKADAQRAVNVYLETDQTSQRAPLVLYGRPGMTAALTVGSGPIRGMLTQDTTLFVVSGSSVYEVTYYGGAYHATSIGTIGSSSGPVGMATNGAETLIVDGVGGWLATSGTLTQITDPEFPNGVKSCCCIGGFFIVTGDGTGRFYYNETPNVGSDWNGLDFASAEGSPDNTVGCIASHLELMLFGSQSAEIWVLTGSSDLPFERSGNTFIEFGTAAYASLATLDNTVFWLGQSKEGAGMVFRANGYIPQRISTHAIEREIQSYAYIDDARAMTLQMQGHSFYILTFPTESKTWVYDVSSQNWTEWAYMDPNTGDLGRWRPECYAYFNGENLVGDFEDGTIYALSMDVYTDDGDSIKYLRATQCMDSPNGFKMTYGPLTVDMETGVGTATGQGQSPVMMLRYSNDGGQSWSNLRQSTVGEAGEYGVRCRFLQNGAGRNRVWEISMTDPVKFAVFGAYVTVTEGIS